MSTQKVKLKHLYSMSAFAKAKNVSRTAVWLRIDNGSIKPVYIGKDADLYIDWRIYKNFNFRNKSTL